jgi:hypothetical protein
MEERITVFINGTPVQIYRGLHVEHALIACDTRLYEAVRQGELIVEDQHGFRVGLAGGLLPGARIFTRRPMKSESERVENEEP